MTDRDELTAADRATLATIDAALDDRDLPLPTPDPLAEFSRVLRDSAPEADHAFRQRLRAEVIGAATAAQADRTGPWWRRRLTRRQAVAAGIVGLGLGGATVAMAQIARLVDAGPPANGDEALVGWAFDQTASAPLTIGPNNAQWAGGKDARYSYSVFTVPRMRQQGIERSLFPQPTPGEALPRSAGRPLLVPAYLPPGFVWQGTSMIHEPGVDAGPIGGTGGGGGSGNLPWQQMPPLDDRDWAYLVGGDQADNFVFLTQLRLAGHVGVRLSALLFAVPDRPVPFAAGPAAQQGGTDRTPTPHPSAYAAKVAAVALAQPAESGAAVTIRSGTAIVQNVTVNGQPAHSFNGVWESNGSWNDTEDWGNLVWEAQGQLYHLAAEHVPLTELIRIAESLPSVP